MDRSQKHELVSSIKEKLEHAGVVVVAHQLGLTVTQSSDLRGKMREANAELKVVKNTLTSIAIQGTKLEAMSEMLTGPTVLAFSHDPISAAKVAVKFAKTNDKLVVVGGFMDGQKLGKQQIEALAELPSLDELRSMIISVIQTPATRIAMIVKEPATRVARVLAARNG